MEEILIKMIYSKFEEKNGIELPIDKITIERVNDACEKAII